MPVYRNSKIDDEGKQSMIKEPRPICVFAKLPNGMMECVQCGFKFSEIEYKVDPYRYCDIKDEYPSDIFSKAARFLHSYEEWRQAGKPVRNIKRVNDIYDTICSCCEFFYADQCTVCGCRIKRDTFFMNKLAWASEKCPLAKPKWKAEEAPRSNIPNLGVIPEKVSKPTGVKRTPVKHNNINEELPTNKVNPRPRKKGCCG